MIIPTVSLPHYPTRPCRPQGGFGLVMVMMVMVMVTNSGGDGDEELYLMFTILGGSYQTTQNTMGAIGNIAFIIF